MIFGAAAASEAFDSVLRGPLEGGGKATIRVSTGHVDGKKVRRYRWRFRQISVDCGGHQAFARDPVKGGFRINAHFDTPGKPWGVQGTAAGDPRDPSYATKVSGRRVSEERAEGWIRVYGSEVPLHEGGSDRCDSGRLHWVTRS